MFIRSTSGDYLNTTVIPKVRPIPVGAVGTGGARFLDEAKRDGAVPIPEALLGDLELASVPVIPTGPATTVICISPTGAVTAAVIVGYRVCRTGLEPLYLVEPPADSTRFLSVGVTGLVRLDDGVLFPNIEAAKASLGTQDQAEPEPVEQKAEVVDMPKVGGRRHAAR